MSRTRSIETAQSCGGSCPYYLYESQSCNGGGCNHGTPESSGGCSCRTGYTGTCCDQDINECELSPPPTCINGECRNRDGSYMCECFDCYQKANPTTCVLEQCQINGNQCYEYNTVNPSNPCQVFSNKPQTSLNLQYTVLNASRNQLNVQAFEFQDDYIIFAKVESLRESKISSRYRLHVFCMKYDEV
ncbi:hypothetical protein ACROYT_G001776 [Oculina patagonica]